VNDLMNLQESNGLIGLCSQLVSGVPHSLPNGISLVEGPKSPNEQGAWEYRFSGSLS
jgi:hypothetical protein